VALVRPREFDETEVLERALGVFWRRGFEGTSIAALVEATGLQRQSLYNAFTDKHGLFRASLAHYRALLDASLAVLARPGIGLAELRAYMDGVLELQRARGVGACLLVKTAFGPEMDDRDVRRAVEEGARAARDRFARVIESAIERGELARTVSPEASAAFLYAVLNGISALARTGERGQVEAVLTHAFDSLGVAGEPARPVRRRHARAGPSRSPR
jgi:TetR/AcrR family transcriptional repressor of nem operon